MDDSRVSDLLGTNKGNGTGESESYHIKRAMSCGLATDIENFFLSDDFPDNLNSYTICEKWLVRVYWDTDLLATELDFLKHDRAAVKRGEKAPCYEKDEWCHSFKKRILQQYMTLPSRKIDTYLDTSLRSPDVRHENVVFSDWSDISEE